MTSLLGSLTLCYRTGRHLQDEHRNEQQGIYQWAYDMDAMDEQIQITVCRVLLAKGLFCMEAHFY